MTINFFITVAGNTAAVHQAESGTTIAQILETNGFPSSQSVLINGAAVDKSAAIQDGQNLFITRENKQGVN